MEEEIDLRPYIVALGQKWHWILGTAVVAGILTLLVSFGLPPKFEAMALVVAVEPDVRIQLDSRIQDVRVERPLNAYPELAMSSDVLLSLFASLPDTAADTQNITQLREMLKAVPGGDPSLIRLQVTANDPQLSADIANMWADLFVSKANEIYGDQSDSQVVFFEEQLSHAATSLEDSEQKLVDFEAQNRIDIVHNELESLKSFQASYLNQKQLLTFLLHDVLALQDQLNRQTRNDVTFADQLTALFLQLQTFNLERTLPLQLHFDTETTLVSDNEQEIEQLLTQLAETLQMRIDSLGDLLVELEPAIFRLQEEKQKLLAEQSQLKRTRDVNESTYLALANKVASEQITSQDVTKGIRLASQAMVPIEPVGPRKLLLAVVAGMLGSLITTLGVLAMTWYSKDWPEQP